MLAKLIFYSLLTQFKLHPPDSKIKISYNVYNATDVKIDAVTDAVISLNNTAAWGVGKKVRYTLTLSSEGATISFAPEVGNWSTSDDTPVAPPAE